jgi:tetratricopeptide (TPR) repeat protein
VSAASSVADLACLLMRRGQYAEAELSYRRVLAAHERVDGPDHPGVAGVLVDLAGVLTAKGDLAAAKPLYERALAIREKTSGRDSTATAGVVSELADLLVEDGRFADAEPMYRRVLATYEKQYGAAHRFVGGAAHNLSVTVCAQGRAAECDQLLQRALAISRTATTEGSATEAAGALARADQLLATRQLHAAEHQYGVALGLYKSALGPDAAEVRACLEKIATVYDRQQKPQLAAFYRQDARTRGAVAGGGK